MPWIVRAWLWWGWRSSPRRQKERFSRAREAHCPNELCRSLGFLFLVEDPFIESKLPRNPGTACRIFLLLSAPTGQSQVCERWGRGGGHCCGACLRTSLIFIAKRAALEKTLDVSVPWFPYL